eukprot:10225473-Alexandrium_andersonii.AAC.1
MRQPTSGEGICCGSERRLRARGAEARGLPSGEAGNSGGERQPVGARAAVMAASGAGDWRAV